MSAVVLVTLFVGILIIIIMLSFPVGYAIGLTSLCLIFLGIGLEASPTIMILRMFRGLSSFTTLAIPFFFLVGKLMNQGGMTKRIFDFAYCLVGRVKGNLGYVNILASMFFAGMSGTAAADAAGLGAIEYKAMHDKGYPEDFSIGITAASTLIGPIIPPSLPLIIYALLSGVSPGGMLIAGLLPGIAIGFVLMIYVWLKSYINNYPYGEKFNVKTILKEIERDGLTLLIPLILIGGILTGWTTVTEAAAIAVFYAFLLIMFVYREVNFSVLWKIICETAQDTAAAMILMGFAFIYSFLVIKSNLPYVLAERLVDVSQNPVVILLILNVFLLILGTFMETISAITILVPILVPTLEILGVNLTHFGIVLVFNLMIGLITPPFGIVLFILSRATTVPLGKVIKSVLPFYIPLIVALFILTIFPQVTLWLPSRLGF